MSTVSAQGNSADVVAGPETSSSIKLFSVGIDIGTSYSGWAYSMKHDDPFKICANATWYHGDSQLASMKVNVEDV